MNRQTQTGVTLYELLIALVIVGIVLSLGVPNMVEFRQNSRITATANDLISAFQLARTESARAKDNITICASSAPMSATPVCGGTWDQGYIVFVDSDGDIVRDGTEEVLRRHEAAQEGVEFAVANDATFFSFGPTGQGRGNVGGNTALSQVVVCDERGNVTAAGGNSASRMFVTAPLGRANVVKENATIGTALTTMGKTCPAET
ncbi:MAG: GspH/FimT family pseudopilin [Pseudomonadota bacterium]